MECEQDLLKGAASRLEMMLVALASLLLVLIMDLITTSLDVAVYHWDHVWYIDMALRGMTEAKLAAPFAFRMGTPLLAGLLHDMAGLTIEGSFRSIAYAGAVLQLTGLYWLLRRLGSGYGVAAIAVVVVALQLMNLRFLMFDVYRPDHLAYAFIVVCFWLAWSDRLMALAIATMVGLQFREFVIVPLVAHVFVTVMRRRDAGEVRRVLLVLFSVILLGYLLPRLLIPVSADHQFVRFSRSGMKAIFKAVTSPARMGNILLAVVSYLLPFLLLVTPERMRDLRSSRRFIALAPYLIAYSLLVLLLLTFGGTDLARFSTYFFLPLAVMLVLTLPMAGVPERIVSVLSVLVVSRVFLPIPQYPVEMQLDFFLPYHDRMTWYSVLRAVEIVGWIVVAGVVRRLSDHRLLQGR